jgi:hypothetical protein
MIGYVEGGISEVRDGLMSLRIAFCTHPAHGHLNPLLPVAHACREAGHRVLFATAPRFCETVRSHGFECCPAGLDYLWSEPMASFPEIADAPRGPDQATATRHNVADMAYPYRINMENRTFMGEPRIKETVRGPGPSAARLCSTLLTWKAACMRGCAGVR